MAVAQVAPQPARPSRSTRPGQADPRSLHLITECHEMVSQGHLRDIVHFCWLISLARTIWEEESTVCDPPAGSPAPDGPIPGSQRQSAWSVHQERNVHAASHTAAW